MSLRIRLVIMIVIIGTLPVLVTVFQATNFMEQQTVISGQKALEEIGKATIYDQALTTAQQVKAYLDRNDSISLENTAAFEADGELATIAVQPVGKTGYTALLDSQGITHFHPNPAIVGVNLATLADSLPDFWHIIESALGGEVSEGYYDWKEADGSIRQKYMVVIPVEGTQLRVAATTYLDELQLPGHTITAEIQQVTAETRRRFILSAFATGAISLVFAIFVGALFTRPLTTMVDAANRVMQGEWDAIQSTNRRDEFGVLQRAFYNMTSQWRTSVQNLEQQVAERTAHLQHRTHYLEATAEVAREATSVLDVENLLMRIVALIAEEFGFYHTGLFLVDVSGEVLNLRAASSPGGQQLVKLGYHLEMNEANTVGWAACQRAYRIALDVGEDAVVFDTPELPATRSQIAMPLRVRDEIIGVLDVQSQAPQAFDEEIVNVLQVLADQVAVAINNAFLFQQVQASAEAERRARGELEFETWRALLSASGGLSVRSTEQATEPAPDVWRPEMTQVFRTSSPVADETGQRFALPIQIGGRVIGVVEGRKAQENGEWIEEERTLLQSLTDQLNAAMERARLYQDTQRRAARERAIAQVGTRVRESLELETMLQVAISEMRQALDLDDLVVRLATPEMVDD